MNPDDRNGARLSRAGNPARILVASSVALALTAATALAGTVPPAADQLDLPMLMHAMRTTSGVVAQFTETKEIALLSAPLEATGTIYFVPPDRLVRVVSSPGRSRLVVNGSRVRFDEDGASRHVDIGANPIARQIVDSFIVLFNGDEAKLNEIYGVRFTADHQSWSLRLEPRSTMMHHVLASLELTGSGTRIDRMEAVEPDGDRTVTRFFEVDTQHRFADQELGRLFDDTGAS